MKLSKQVGRMHIVIAHLDTICRTLPKLKGKEKGKVPEAGGIKGPPIGKIEEEEEEEEVEEEDVSGAALCLCVCICLNTCIC